MKVLTLILVLILTIPARAESMKLGVIAPLSKGNSHVGEDIEYTIRSVIQDYLHKNPDSPIKVIFEDGQCGNGNLAQRAAMKLLTIDKVDGLIVACSGSVLQVSPIASKYKTPLIAVYSSHKDIKNLGPYVFRTFIDMESGVDQISQQIDDSNYKCIAIMTEQNAFTQGVADLLVENITRTEILHESFGPDQEDFRSQILRLRQTDAVFLNAASARTLGILVKQLANQNLTLPKFSYLIASDKSFQKNVGSLAKEITYLDLPDIESSSPEFKNFMARFRESRGEPAIPYVIASTYNALLPFLSTWSKKPLRHQALQKSLASFDQPGAIGRLNFDKNGDIAGVQFKLVAASHD